MNNQQILKPTYVLFVLEGIRNAVFKQLFLGPAMFETPFLHNFLFENVLKSTKSQVLKSWERHSTWPHRDAFQNTQLPCFVKGEIMGYKAANGGRERSGTQDTMLKEKKTVLTWCMVPSISTGTMKSALLIG